MSIAPLAKSGRTLQSVRLVKTDVVCPSLIHKIVILSMLAVDSTVGQVGQDATVGQVGQNKRHVDSTVGQVGQDSTVGQVGQSKRGLSSGLWVLDKVN